MLGWQSVGYDDWVRSSAFLLGNPQPGELVFFSCYAAAVLVPLISCFLLTLLEFYGLQLHHLPPLSHTGGNLYPLLRDVHLRVAIDHPFLAVPHAMMGWEGD
jgi:hypothetical protein